MYCCYVIVAKILLFYHFTVIVKLYETWNLDYKGSNDKHVR